MAKDLLTPKFLTTEIAGLAVERVFDAVFNGGGVCGMVKRKMCHIVILVPSSDPRPAWTSPVGTIRPHILYQKSFGNPKEWPHQFDAIARGKAEQLWSGRNDGRTGIQPHLFFAGDTPFYGGVRRDGIVVACSGIQSYFDQMISGMVADMCIGLAYWEWETSTDKKDDKLCFLT